MADYDWGKPCCGQIIGHKHDCPKNTINIVVNGNRSGRETNAHNGSVGDARKRTQDLMNEAENKIPKSMDWVEGHAEGYQLGLMQGKAERDRLRDSLRRLNDLANRLYDFEV